MPATCGELVQGTLEGRPFQVPCPLGIRGHVCVTARYGTGRVWGTGDHPKARDAARAVLRHAGSPPVDLHVALRTPVRRGAGMGSSTCDVVGTLQGTSRALGFEMDTRLWARLAARIEPTNGVMFDRLVAFDHVEGRVLETLGDPPPMQVLVLDVGGTVDTLELHRRRSNQERADAPGSSTIYRDLLARLRKGIRKGDPEAVGEAATRSAQLIRSPARNEAVEIALDLSCRYGGFGVAAAHSGTVAGMLFPDDPERVRAALLAARKIRSVVRVGTATLEAGSGTDFMNCCPKSGQSLCHRSQVL